MNFKKAALEDMNELIEILKEYKKSICESPFTHKQLSSLEAAIANENIYFYMVKVEGDVVGVCSATLGFSTFRCSKIGILEDFYISPDFRNRSIGKKLANYVFSEMEDMEITSLSVGCSDIDVNKYKNLGFNIGLGNLLIRSTVPL